MYVAGHVAALCMSLVTCLLCVSVLNSAELKKSTDNIWVLGNKDHVVTRFFFV